MISYPDLFTRCIKVILKNEGGYGNHPADKGGETNYGIADAADGKKDGLIDIDGDGMGDIKVRDLGPDQAKEVYFLKYWRPMNLMMIKNENLVLQVFDMGVNAGPRTAIKILQRILGAKVDGVCGFQTIGMANNFIGDLTGEFITARKKYYLDLVKMNPEQLVFVAGWLNRAERTKF